MSECPRPDKIRYRTFNDALKGRDATEAKKGIDLALRPYRCVCGAWHLGRRDKTLRRFRRYSGRRLK